jgi:hypothetical protein
MTPDIPILVGHFSVISAAQPATGLSPSWWLHHREGAKGRSPLVLVVLTNKLG